MLLPTIKYVFDRHKREAASGTGTIELRISYNNKHKYISTGIKVPKSRWDEKNQAVSGILEAKDYNIILSRLRTKVMEILQTMDKSGCYDLDAIPSMLKSNSQDITFLEYIELRIEREKGVKTANTIKNHQVFLRKMQSWGYIKNFSDITYANIQKMNEWLHLRKLKDETIYGYNKFLRLFINNAIADGLLKENPYSTKQIKLKHGEPNADSYITEKELLRLKEVKLTGSLGRVRDVFVFQCLTGMAYADLSEFNAKKVKEIEGYKVYSGKRGKTGIPFFCVLFNDAMEILAKYNNKLPVISNQQYNLRLKVVADVAGIDKKLTTHWARHTAATIWINRGLPIEIISKMLGHSSTRITEKVYSMLQEKTIVDAVAKMKKGGL